jgi:hypothetical protein
MSRRKALRVSSMLLFPSGSAMLLSLLDASAAAGQ